MNCPRCNTPLTADTRLCGVCGASIPMQPVNIPAPGGVPAHEEATLIVSRPEAQAGFQPTTPAGWPQYGPAGPVPQARGAPWAQPPLQPWVPPQAGMSRGTGNSGQPGRRRRIWLSVLISLLIVLIVLAGSWFLAVRPYLHGMAQAQLDRAVTDAGDQIVLLQAALPPGSRTITATEDEINAYLSAHDTNQLQNLHMTISPTGLQLDFQAYGFGCTILGLPVASGGAFQVTNVQVQGMLGLIMSSDELTNDLNSHFQDIGQQMHRSISLITLGEHKMDIQVS